jgi:hypothetical protein
MRLVAYFWHINCKNAIINTNPKDNDGEKSVRNYVSKIEGDS